MAKSRHLLLHFACFLAGWGIIAAFSPALSSSAESRAATKASVRDARAREEGEKLLHRLAPDIAPAPQLEVKRHEGTLQERAFHAFLNNTFPANPGTPDDESITDYLRSEIHGTLFGENGPDLSYAFRHGRMEAPQVLATLRQTFPDLAGEGLFDKAVFLELFKVDPTRAAVLLNDVSRTEGTSWFEVGVLGRSENPGPEILLAWRDLALSGTVETDSFSSPEIAGILARDYLKKFGSDYTEWLLAQPPTKGLEFMVEALTLHLDSDDPAAAVALRKRLFTH